MSKYQHAKIYIITNQDRELVYIGSTTKKYLSSRMSQHRYDYKKHRQGKGYRCRSYDLFDQFDVNYCKIELLERFPCNDRQELEDREAYHIKLGGCVNRNKRNY